jgi:integrase
MPARHRIPSYRRHKPSGQAVVTLDGIDHYLGAWNTKASTDKYDRIVSQWQANGRRLPQADSGDLTIVELLAAYIRHAKVYYVKNGKPTSEQALIHHAVRPLKQLYGRENAADFGPIKLKAVRNSLIRAGLCRKSVNDHIWRIKRIFNWGVENELIPPSVSHGLQAVHGLRRGRSEARESEPVKPVPEAFVAAVLPHVSPQVAAMLRLQMITGMRSSEVVTMRGLDLDMSGRVWCYTPVSHKTEHHGHDKVIFLGPHAQEIIRPWTNLEAYLFSPSEAEVDRQRKSYPRYKGTMRRRGFKPHYSTSTYYKAVRRGIEKANEQVEGEQSIPLWHPHQLRHNAATRLRKKFGLDAARVVLVGHRSAMSRRFMPSWTLQELPR